jgi:hypothetical protein
MKRKNTLILAGLILSAFACAPMNTSINVRLSLDTYQPAVDASRYAEYKGQPVVFDSIDVDSQSVANMYFTSKDGEVGYTLFYAPDKMQTPVASFFWYALDKTFRTAGIDIRETGPIKNAPGLLIKIIALTDQDIKFQVTLSRNGYMLLQKNMACSKVLPPTKTDVPELRRRMFAMIDLMAGTVLSDPDFKREFFSDKGKI